MGVLLASPVQRPGMLLTILQSTRQPPTTKNYVIQNINSDKAENPVLEMWVYVCACTFVAPQALTYIGVATK